MFSPSTRLRLLNVPFSSDGLDTIYFDSLSSQQAYFSSKVKKDYGNDFQYTKKDASIVVDGTPEELYMINYVMYMNENFSNKWFYAFVTRMEWASMNSTRLYIMTDPIQTWLFELQLYSSYIIRQHSTTDEAGDNIQPEPFSVSMTKYQNAGSIDCRPDWIAIYATCSQGGSSVSGSFVGGIYSGAGQVFFDSVSPDNTLKEYVNNGLADAVSRIQQAASLGESAGPPQSKNFNFNKHPNNVDGYVPKNNKILSGAFCHGYFGGFGQTCEFIPEFCLGNGCTVKVLQDYTSGALYFYVPDYGLVSAGNDNVFMGFTVTIPESTWAYNQYKNEYNLHNASNSMLSKRLVNRQDYSVLRNAASIAVNAADAVSSYVPLGGDFSVGDNVLAAMDSANSLVETLGGYDEISQQLQYIAESYTAPATGGVATSNVFIASGQCFVNYGWLVPDRRFAEAYDNFLTMYGYAQNKYAVPNLHARKSFTYIKVSELHAGGEVPDSDMLAIKALFAKGIYFWDSSATIGDFSQDNSIV